MRKILLTISFASLLATSAIAQDQKNPFQDEYNKWSIELGTGHGKGIRPYATGYFANHPEKVMGGFMFNHYEAGVRYMFSPRFGLKVDAGYDLLQNFNGTQSPDFELEQIRIGVQGVVNAARLFNIQDQLGRFGMLLHGGLQFSQMTPKTGVNEGVSEHNGGIIVGFTPGFRVTKNIALFADFSLLSNVRQHFNWDGSYSDADNNLAGSMYNATVGISISFGAEKIHGDWAEIQDIHVRQLAALEERVGKIETDLLDSDQDGVPDYLDSEANSITGVAVDSKGRMIDLNNNGVPDELERYLDKTYINRDGSNVQTTDGFIQNITANDKEVIKGMINDGYVAAYFDFNKSQPTSASTEGIDFILTYLRNNPEANVEIIGNADEIGSNEVNDRLATGRAENIKNILIKAGVNPNRISVLSNGKDKSVDINSSEARRLVRKVTFKIK